ncbi:intein-containing Rv2578c family radical SAM protein [Pseudactinotalea sp. Z1739]|uniref:intein-containing Rv2578c family radical SAM protein n=1 Tax=Pseudactinotalea sp. Z1739 TaxID=3413028 RepID=UPI003C7D33F6
MRWSAQQIDDSRALLPMRGLIRSVRTPEFDGVTFHEVACKSALNKVPSTSQMPFGWTINPTRGCLHRCTYCLSPDTLILMADGRQKFLRDVKVGDRVVGTSPQGKYRRYVEAEIQAVWSTVKPAYRVTLRDGTQLSASGDHRFLTERGWKHVVPAEPGGGQRPYLTSNDRLMGFGAGDARYATPAREGSADYQRGYLTGMIRGDGMMIDRTYSRRSTGRPYRVTIFRLALADPEALERSRRYLAQAGIGTALKPYTPATVNRRPLNALYTSTRTNYAAIKSMIEWPAAPGLDWWKGYLAGFFDAEGSYSGGTLRFSNSDEEILTMGLEGLERVGIPGVLERRGAGRASTIRIPGGRATHHRFFHHIGPSITRKLNVVGDAVKTSSDLRVESVEFLGDDQDLIDITTSTGDFIANGVISHNCFARKTHEYLDLDSGQDFDTQIVVKTNIVEVLRAELARPSWQREHVALGTNSDPYMRAEGRYELMPGIIEALAQSGTPISILTKGPLLRRDLPLLATAAPDTQIGVSLAFIDPHLQQLVEPGTPPPKARLGLIRSVREAGLDCHVLAMPILPWLTDGDEHLEELFTAVHASGAQWISAGPLHLRPGAREWFMRWLAAERPDLVGRYRRLYSGSSYVPKDYGRWLSTRVDRLRRRLGFTRPERSTGDDDAPDRWQRAPERAAPVPGAPAGTEPAQPVLF